LRNMLHSYALPACRLNYPVRGLAFIRTSHFEHIASARFKHRQIDLSQYPFVCDQLRTLPRVQSKCKVQISATIPHVEERIITVTGDVTGIFRAYSFIADKLRENEEVRDSDLCSDHDQAPLLSPHCFTRVAANARWCDIHALPNMVARYPRGSSHLQYLPPPPLATARCRL
jgi:hypothetical protein